MIGGAAGCFPALIGWSAVTGSIGWPAVDPVPRRLPVDAAALLGAGAALQGRLRGCRRADAAGGRDPDQVGRQIVYYTYAMVAASLLLGPVADTGLLYLVVAAVLGRGLHRAGAPAAAAAEGAARTPASMRLFHWSTTYLTLLFAAVAISPFLT